MKNVYKNTKLYASVIEKIRREFGDSFADNILSKANDKYCQMELIIGEVPKAHKRHVAQVIERAALYAVLKENFPDKAYDMVYEPSHKRNVKANHFIGKITKRKSGARFFIWMMYRIGDTVFSEESGHKKVWKLKEKTCAAFDMIECPYVKYNKILGYPELAKSFCNDDIEVFNHLPNIKYTRPKTLGNGDEKCDFRMELDYTLKSVERSKQK